MQIYSLAGSVEGAGPILHQEDEALQRRVRGNDPWSSRLQRICTVFVRHLVEYCIVRLQTQYSNKYLDFTLNCALYCDDAVP